MIKTKDRIKKIRQESNMSQSDFAKKLLISRSAVCKMESGENTPSIHTKELLCRIFSVNKDWLETGNGEPYIPQTQNQEIMAFANDVMSEETESFRKRFVTAISKARPEFWDELEKVVDDILKKD